VPGSADRELPGFQSPGAVAQLGERRVCNAEVAGSIPVGSNRQPGMLRRAFPGTALVRGNLRLAGELTA
jgi:hypothetical protein